MRLWSLALCTVFGCDDALFGAPGTDGPLWHGTFPRSTSIPVQGGTLTTLSDGGILAADPEGDRAVVLETDGRLRWETAFAPLDTPGRSAEGPPGTLFVVLRQAGDLVTLDAVTGEIVEQRYVCPQPRGVAWSDEHQSVVVACASGEVVALAPAGPAPMWSTYIAAGLRDPVWVDEGLLIVPFRGRGVYRLDPDTGEILDESGATRVYEAAYPLFGEAPATTRVQWRSIPTSDGSVLTLGQRHTTGRLGTTATDPNAPPPPPEYYASGDTGAGSSPCTRIVTAGVTSYGASGESTATAKALDSLGGTTLGVDLAVWPDAVGFTTVAIANAGGRIDGPRPDHALVYTLRDFSSSPVCSEPVGRISLDTHGVATSVAWDALGRLVVQTMRPFGVFVGDALVFGSTTQQDDDAFGFDVFHADLGGGIACASCHPEGGDDGHIWRFAVEGPRRTQVFPGGGLQTAPFHWAGDQPDFEALIEEVMVTRMGSRSLDADELSSLLRFLEGIVPPRATPPVTVGQVTRGRALFESPEVGCADCHSGQYLTNNETVSVFEPPDGASDTTVQDTAEPRPPTQVPSLLGVGGRGPWMSDGCAPTLRSRFESDWCGGAYHGNVDQLSSEEIDDLVAYLTTL